MCVPFRCANATHSKLVESLCGQSCASTPPPGLSISRHNWRIVWLLPPASTQRTPARSRQWTRKKPCMRHGSHTVCCRLGRRRRSREETVPGWKGSGLEPSASSDVAGCGCLYGCKWHQVCIQFSGRYISGTCKSELFRILNAAVAPLLCVGILYQHYSLPLYLACPTTTQKCFPHYNPSAREIRWTLLDSPYKGPVMRSCAVTFVVILKK